MIGSWFRPPVVCVAAICGLAAVGSALAQEYYFDGVWHATARTVTGKCTDRYSFQVQVDEGRIAAVMRTRSGSFRLAGYVDDGGNSVITMDGSESGEMQLVFGTGTAHGQWSTLHCTGTIGLIRRE